MSRANIDMIGDRILRNLGGFERALFLSDQHAPFNVVSMLRLDRPPVPALIHRNLLLLQGRHPFLQACIKDGKLVHLSEPAFPFQITEQEGEPDWLKVVEHEMNTRLEPERGLFRGGYLYNPERAGLFLTFHHSIIDSASLVHLCDQLLQLCAAPPPPDELLPPAPLKIAPPVEEQFPSAFKGWLGWTRTTGYAFAQMADEIRYRWRVRGKRTPSVRLGGRGFPLTLHLPASLVEALSRRCRAHKVTFNSLLNASLLLAANRHLYAGDRTPLRTFSFADLRPYTAPPTPAEQLANYISMLRYTVDVAGETDIWELTGTLHDKIHRSFKKGHKFLASRMSEPLIKMFVGMKSMRMGATALNYSGAIPLKSQYGQIGVQALHGFLSSFDLGPEVSAQARLFKDELWMDLMFLETDLAREKAAKVVGEIQSILERAGGG